MDLRSHVLVENLLLNFPNHLRDETQDFMSYVKAIRIDDSQ